MKTRQEREICNSNAKASFAASQAYDTEHTPGPWKAVINTDNNRETWISVVGDNETTEIYSARDYGNASRPMEADARLIAAAPELLEMLKDLRSSNVLAGMTDLNTGKDLNTKLAELIAKAEGR